MSPLRQLSSGSPFYGESKTPIRKLSRSKAEFQREDQEVRTKRSFALLCQQLIGVEMEGYRRPRPGSSVPEPAAAAVSATAGPSSLSASRESMDIVCQLSDLLQTGLSRDALVALVDLLESGVSPEAVAAAISEIRREVAAGGCGGGSAPLGA